ncbi:Transcriptional regulator NRG1 [Paramyrothecium foliicola]|nr:Transcriptional regulator NRG1 [Paramyrothecium foliicola]
MHARDAAGRKVSLLNDEPTSQFDPRQQLHQRSLSFQPAPSQYAYPASRSNSSSPNTPELLRSSSYDSQMSNDPVSPLTPSVDFSYPRGGPLYSIGHEYADAPPAKRPAYVDSSRSTSFEDEASATSPLPERPGKRYPCRYRESHGCEKTFTTSGHASRHSKIHTAEKAVQCTYPGCQKKFTRADNMKQHLETHYKDKSRSSSGQRAHKTSLAEARRNSSSSRSRSSGRVSPQWETEQFPLPTPPLPTTPGAPTTWDMRGLNLPILNRPAAAGRTPSGLDALAMAVACQEGC